VLKKVMTNVNFGEHHQKQKNFIKCTKKMKVAEITKPCVV